MSDLEKLINQTEEIIGLEDLKRLLEKGYPLNHYIGCEISGLVHLGTGLMSGIVARNLQNLGVNTTYFMADWHTWINNKLKGDRELIKRVAEEYFGPALLVSAEIAGADPQKITLKHGSDIYHNNDAYWQSFMEIGKNLTLSRIVKSTSILGRDESSSNPFAYLMYPVMQAADIFEMNCQIAHAGTDQRKIHVIAREVAQSLNIHFLEDPDGGKLKPISIHHHLLLGLQAPKTWPLPENEEKDTLRTQMKMSKSIPGSAIFIHDTEDEIRAKLKDAFCPPNEINYNPVLDWVQHMILPIKGSLNIKRDEKFGGSFTVNNYEELAERFNSGDLHPVDLKNNIAEVLVEMLEPARKAFDNESAKKLIVEIKENQSR